MNPPLARAAGRILPGASAFDLRLVGFGALIYLFSGVGQTYLFQFVRPDVMASFSLSEAQFGRYYMIGTLASGLLILVTGRIFDWFDLRLIAVVVLLGAAVSCFLFAANPFAWALVPIFLLQRQFGQGLMSHVSSASMARYFTHLRGRATSITNLSYSLGEMLLPLLASLVFLPWLGWRGLYVVLGITLVLAVLPLALALLRGHGRRHADYLAREQAEDAAARDAVPGSRRTQWTLGEVVTNRTIWLLLPTLLAPSFTFTGLAMFGLDLADQLEVSRPSWAWLWGVYALFQLSITYFLGWLVDRFTATRLVPLVAAPMALAMLIVQPFTGLGIAALMLMGWALCQGATAVVLGPLFAELYGAKHLGAIKAFFTSMMVIASAGGPFVVGSLIEAGMSIKQIGLWFAAYIAAASLVALVGVARLRVKPLRRAHL